MPRPCLPRAIQGGMGATRAMDGALGPPAVAHEARSTGGSRVCGRRPPGPPTPRARAPVVRGARRTGAIVAAGVARLAAHRGDRERAGWHGHRERRGRVLPVDPYRRDPDGRSAGGRRSRTVDRTARALPRRRRWGHPDRSHAIRVGGRGDPVHRGRAGARSRHPPDPVGRRCGLRGRSRCGATRLRGVDARPGRGRASRERSRSAGLSPRERSRGLPPSAHPPSRDTSAVASSARREDPVPRRTRPHPRASPAGGVGAGRRPARPAGRRRRPPGGRSGRRAARVHHPSRLHRRARAPDQRRGGHGQRGRRRRWLTSGAPRDRRGSRRGRRRSGWSRCRDTTSLGGATRPCRRLRSSTRSRASRSSSGVRTGTSHS